MSKVERGFRKQEFRILTIKCQHDRLMLEVLIIGFI